MARGLFQRAIAQSGSPIGEWAVQRRPRMYVERLARKLQCPDTSSSHTILDCLRSQDVQTIVDKSEDASLEDSLMLQFAPSVDGRFLPDHPTALLQREGALGPGPPPQTLVGVTRDELEVWMTKSYQDKDPSTIKFTRELLRRYLLHLVRRELASGAAADVLLHAVYTEYVYRHAPQRRRQQNGTEPRREDGAALPDIRTLGKIISDIDLKAPSVRLVELLTLHPGTSVYLYEFDYASSDDVIAAKYVGANNLFVAGSYHESELYYLFGFPHFGLENALRLPQDKQVSDTMIRLWTNFARTGEPTPAESNRSTGFWWRPYTQDDDCFASLGLEPFVARSYESERMTFWNHFVPLFTEYPVNLSANRSAPHHLFAGLSCDRTVVLALLALLVVCSLLLCCSATAIVCCCRKKRTVLEEIPVPV
ncbi:acetylcholinesterase-like [Uloborus diversus]|uniref:acetylcholinesterase-like n=1 Tax=Uloborus diversus TaxID=327109 RepID=UPI00240911A3|nr:acetylcholinesterase-like [Uloborus diversus]